MKLFRYEGYKVVISEEAFALKVFRQIWNRDRSVNKDKAIMELGYVYFLSDPRSDYQYIVDATLLIAFTLSLSSISSKENSLRVFLTLSITALVSSNRRAEVDFKLL